ncbi:MAG: beta strand repeat-containing protein [Candidatus Dormibacteria bacterium]
MPRLGVGLVATAGALALGLAAIGPVSARTAQLSNATSTTSGTYVSVTPTRIADTRANSGQAYAGQTLGAGGMLQVQVPTSLVPAGASAVVLNVTAVDPTAAGFISVLPGGETLPTGSSLVSNLNFAAGVIVPNQVTVGLSTTGTVEIYNYTGSTNVVVDVAGYYTSTPASSGSGLYNAISPFRALGTLANGQTIGANSTQAVTVTGGSTGVPASATAVVVNVTAAGATAPSFLTAFPAGGTMPLASNLNFGAQVANQAIANRATVGVSGGQIDVYNHAGSVRVDVDINGYYTGTGGTGSTFTAITPQRLTDTRVPTNGSPIAASTSETFSLTNSSIPANAAGVAANFTVVPGADPGYITVYPTADTAAPVASDVNWTASEFPAVPNYTIADTAGTGNVAVFNSHGATINLLIDAFGYFGPSNSGTPTMVSAAVTDTSIAITYNEAVSCPTTGADGAFAYDWTGTASGITSVSGCTTSGDVLTLAGSFTLPASTGGSITYTAPTSPTSGASGNAVYATNNTAEFAATQTIAVPAGTVPAMVSAYTTATTLVITYNEDVSCASGAAAAFAYNYTGAATGFSVTSGTLTVAAGCATDVVTLTASGTGAAVAPPGSGASIVYTAPATNSSTVSVYATGSVSPVLYAATQTLSGSAWTTPAITGATVTAGASGTIAVTYSGDGVMTCPTTGGATVQTEFAYSNGGTPAYPSTCTNTTTHVITLGTFYAASSGTTAATLVLPGASDTLTYTAPAATNTTANSVHDTLDFPQFAATQSFALTATAVPTMNSAVVTTGSKIAITFSAAVSCPATGADGAFVYDSAVSTPGGTATGCTTSGDVLTLTGNFNAESGSASLTYTEPGTPSTSNAVYATGTTTDFVATTTISGSAITA